MAYPRPYKENALSTDWYTKLVLTVLAVCAAILVAQDLREAGAGAGEGGRYTVQAFPMARMMIRTDTETGKTWRASFPELKVWIPIADEPLETLDDAAPAKPEPREEAEQAAPEAPAEAPPTAPTPES
jgi:hypothetical protein